MKTSVELAPRINATLCTDEDVPSPRKSPVLFIESYETASEGLGGHGAPDVIEICGEDALQKLSQLLATRSEGK